MLNYEDINFNHNEPDLASFFNTRAKVTRQQDGKVLAAWVSPNPSGQLQLTIGHAHDFQPGDLMDIVLTNARQSINLVARFIGESGGRGTFQVLQDSAPTKPVERMRKQEEGAMARIISGGMEAVVPVRDVAPGGVAVTAPFMMQADTFVRLTVQCRLGLVNMEARVVYCRPEENLFRVGFQITRLQGNDEIIWWQLLESA